ncbi:MULTISPECIES: hypothetical protein [unclassified Microcoleus]|uniref:hypothetical protein n=1 Tax=unclassified Microcoleus TaxID=2642155 RepID=UPI0025D3716F|nr:MULTISPECIES: hypothetical protein [unclassified Microcoleus]
MPKGRKKKEAETGKKEESARISENQPERRSLMKLEDKKAIPISVTSVSRTKGIGNY